MEKRKNVFIWLLIVLMLFSVTVAGCASKDTAAAPDETPAVTEPAVDETAAQLEAKEFVNIYIYTPVEWFDVYVWAWKDGGENVSEEWPGIPAEVNNEMACISVTVPGWVDRVIISEQTLNVQTEELSIEPGKDVSIATDAVTTDIFYDILLPDPQYMEPVYEDPIYLAAQEGDFETVKSLLPTIEDRSILNDWVFDGFNYSYALEAILAGDYETAIEFFRYCTFDNHYPNADIIEYLLSGDREAALDTICSMEYARLDRDLDMSWAEIINMVTGSENASELDLMLMDEYVSMRLRNYEPTFAEDTLSFGSTSSWMARDYIGEITDTTLYYPIENIKTLKSQCGSEANGKVLILRSQKAYPQGTAYYAIDQLAMSYLSADLYPASLSEVEYIITASYDYTVEGTYRQTISNGDNSVSDEFAYLRMKGQVQLQNVATGQNIQTSPWIQGTGEVEAHFSDLSYQCSNLPETGAHIYSAVEKVRELNGA